MNDEDAFQAALDANPADGLLRQVFADWLDEHGDPRGPGYRVLGVLGKRPCSPCDPAGNAQFAHPGYANAGEYEGDFPDACHKLPDAWVRAAGDVFGREPLWTTRRTRREADDAAALGWSRLTPDQQAALLALARA